MNGHNPLRPVVLLVEDEPFIRLATADALEDAGFEVIETANAQAAGGSSEPHGCPGAFHRREDARPHEWSRTRFLVRSRWPHISVVITSVTWNRKAVRFRKKPSSLPNPMANRLPPGTPSWTDAPRSQKGLSLPSSRSRGHLPLTHFTNVKMWVAASCNQNPSQA